MFSGWNQGAAVSTLFSVIRPCHTDSCSTRCGCQILGCVLFVRVGVQSRDPLPVSEQVSRWCFVCEKAQRC
jgi:hypothetical protein